jgi:hypothetical protein
MEIFHTCGNNQDLKQLPQHMVLNSQHEWGPTYRLFLFSSFQQNDLDILYLNITESFHILQCFFIQHTKQIPAGLENMLLKL